MSRGFTGALMRAYGTKEWTFTVISIEDLTPYYRRITFHAPGYVEGVELGPASYVRFWMPDPDDPDRQHHRAYTVVDADPDNEMLSIEVVLHTPSGPASEWAARAEVGDTVATTKWGTPRFVMPQPRPAGYLLVGDPAAIPAINGVLRELPDEMPAEVVLEYTYDDDQTLPLSPRSQTNITWIRRTGDADLLARSIPERDYSDWAAWVTAESAATRSAKNRLHELGFPKAAIKAQAYWKQGKAMGTDRHETDASSAEPERATTPEPAPDPASTPGPTPGPSASWRIKKGAELLAPLKGRLALAGAAQAVISLLQLAPYVVLIELCRRLLTGTLDSAELGTLVGWVAGFALSALVLSTLLLVALHALDARFGHEVRGQIVERLQRMPLGWFTDRSPGVVKRAADDDPASLHLLVTHAVLDLVAAVITPLAVLIYLFVTHAGLAAVLMVPLVIVYLLTMRLYSASSYGTPIFEDYRERISGETAAFVDGIAATRIYDSGQDGRLASLLAERAEFLDRWQRPLIDLKTIIDLVTRPTTSLLVIVVTGGFFVMAGWMTPADLVPFLLLGVTFGAQLLTIAYGGVALRESAAAAQRIGLLLSEPTLVESEASVALPQRAQDDSPEVRFEAVRFGYTPARTVVRDVTLSLPAGRTTALVGPSGAGKSTLAELLARFHDVDAGKITIAGADIRDLSPTELYRTVGFVFQGPALIEATVHDNISLGHPGISRDDVEEAAKTAQIHDRITRLDSGYDTVVGTDVRLSGGEAQRVAIARLLVADPPVLVLDEATSFADPESERQLQQAMSALVTGRTVLVIAHRLHTVTNADQMVVLNNGEVVEQGSHNQLLSHDGLYRSLWAAHTNSAMLLKAAEKRS